MRRGITLLGTVAVVAGAVWAVGAGSDRIAERADAAAGAEAAPPVPVAVQPLILQSSFTVRRRYLGQIEAAQDSVLSFEFSGRLARVAVDEGDGVDAGAVLAELDTALLQTERAQLVAAREALLAQLEFAEASVERRAALRDRGFTATEALDEATSTRDRLTAQIQETDAALETIAVRLEKSVLRAPFAGRVSARSADTGATLSAGTPVVELMQTAAPRVRVGLPLDVSPALGESLTIEIDGQDYAARLVRLRPDVDPATRTRTAIFALDSAPAAVFGQTATLVLPREVAGRGAWVPLRSLREGVQGTWTVLTVDAEQRVRSAAVEVLHLEAERAYVAGSFPEGAQLIEAGPHRVTPGQLVRIASEV